jgi:hypothetical protein
MAMLRTGRVAATRVGDWLEDVQRDPRTVGSFRRRIESLLRDPAVARRVALRLDLREEAGRSTPREIEPDCARDGAAPRSRALVAAFLGAEDGSVSIFGSCDCSSRCCLMVPQLRGHHGMGLVLPRSEARGG